MAERLEQVISALDRLHAEDPRSVDKGGTPIAAELLYAQRMSAWLATLAENPSECLQIAVRAFTALAGAPRRLP